MYFYFFKGNNVTIVDNHKTLAKIQNISLIFIISKKRMERIQGEPKEISEIQTEARNRKMRNNIQNGNFDVHKIL